MKSQKTILSHIMLVGIVLVFLLILWAVSHVSRSISTLDRFPAQDILPSPTFTTTEVFTCWDSPARKIPVAEMHGLGRLLITFWNENGQVLNLFQFDLATAKLSQLVPNIESYNVNGPSPVSPSGQYLWYGVYKNASDDVIFVYDLVDNSIRQVTFPGKIYSRDAAIGWSANSECLIWWTNETATAYRLMDGAMQQRSFPKASFGNEVSVSPTGYWWAWPCKTGTCIMTPEGQEMFHESLDISSQGDKALYSGNTSQLMQWSPDGETLAFAYIRNGYRYRPVLFDQVRLVHFDNNHIASYQDVDSGLGIYNLRWSPDGSQLLISHDGGNALAVYHVGLGELTEILSPYGYHVTTMPVWSPSGKQIIFVAKDFQSVYAMNPDSTNMLKIPIPNAASSRPDVEDVFWIP